MTSGYTFIEPHPFRLPSGFRIDLDMPARHPGAPGLQVDTALLPRCARTTSGAIVNKGNPETTMAVNIKNPSGHVKTAVNAAVASLALTRDDRRNEKRLNLTPKTAKTVGKRQLPRGLLVI
jgi:hypothetical protein